MGIIRQSSFAAGELAPQLWGRTDSPLRGKGVKACRNFFISKHGASHSRPGLVNVGRCRTHPADLSGWRLIPFIYSDSQSYVLEFGPFYVRVWSNGAPVVDAAIAAYNPATNYADRARVSYGGKYWYSIQAANLGNQPDVSPAWWREDSGAVEVATPYAAADVSRLKSTQSGDVLFLAHPSYAPRVLTRTAHTAWALAVIDFDRPLGSFLGSAGMGVQTPLPAAVAGYPAREWKWLWTQLNRDARGFWYESRPEPVTNEVNAGAPGVVGPLPATISPNPTNPAILQVWGGAITDSVKFRLYRGNGELYGWVGDTDGDTLRDIGDPPDYTFTPPRGDNPFKVYDYATVPPTLSRTEYPSVVGFFEERLGFANTTQRPSYIFLSATGDYYNFDRHVLPMPDDGGEWDLMARRREEIRNWIPLAGKLILLTNSSVWSFGGAGGEAVSPGGLIDAKPHIDIGSSWVDALRAGNSVLYVRAKGTGVRDLAFDLERGSYSGGDISFIAQHLFENRTVTDWAYQEDPWGVVWAVRSDGRLLSLTYDRDNGVLAWALHTTGEQDDGTFDAVSSVCSVPETDEDGVYVIVTRYGFPFLERLASRVLPFKADGVTYDTAETIALDHAITYRGAAANVITGLGDFNGEVVWALADGKVCGPFTVAGGQIDLTAPDAGGAGLDVIGAGATVVHVGLTYECNFRPLELSQDGNKEKLVRRVLVEVDASRGLWVGPDADHLFEWAQRTVADSYDVLSAATGVVDMPVQSGWDTTGDILLQQRDPLFVSIYAVSRDVEMGGR